MSYKTLSHYQHDFCNLNEENLLNSFANNNSSYLKDNSLGVNAKLNRFLFNVGVLVNTHTPLKKLTKKVFKIVVMISQRSVQLRNRVTNSSLKARKPI